MALQVMLDPGHGGRDRFNQGPAGYVEADGALDMARRAAALLRAAGARVRLTRQGDTDLVPGTGPWGQEARRAGLLARAALANGWPASLFVSIHTNALAADTRREQPEVRGTETYVQAGSPASQAAGRQIQGALTAALGTRDRGVWVRDLASGALLAPGQEPPGAQDYYLVLRECRVPAVLVEVEFHDHPEAEQALLAPGFRQQAAGALAAGILDWAAAGPVPAR